MIFTKKLTALAVAALASWNASAAVDAMHAADTIFYHGTIVTVNEKQPEAAALAIKDGMILAVGSSADILKNHVGDQTKLIDLHGRTLMPGFVEPHVHISLTAITENVTLDLSNFTLPYDTVDTLVAKLRAYKDTLPEGSWILGFGVDPSRTVPLMAELNADVLDQVSTTNPIFILNQSGHIAYVNHKALALAEVANNTPNPGNGGVYVKDAQGKLTGVLNEPPSYYAFFKKLTPPSETIIVDAYKKTVNNIAARGVTTSAEIAMGSVMPLDKEYAMVNALSHEPGFPIRVRGYLWGVELPEGYASLKPNQGDDRFRVIGVKYIADGSTQGLTAAISQPYSYPVGSKNRGALNWTSEAFLKASKPYFDQGWQISIHANGDRAIGQTLNLYASLLKNTQNPTARRLRIEHFTTATDQEIAQAQKLGVNPSMTIGHVGFWGEVFHNHILGSERADRIDPTGSLVKRGMRFSFHSDSPVSPYNPLQYIATGASRMWQKSPRQVLGRQQLIGVDQAIKAVTLNAAYAMFMDTEVGSIEMGKWADLVMLDANPRETALNQIPQIKVLQTWVNGQPAYVAQGAE